MGAQRCVELDEARLIESADQMPGVADHLFDGGAVTRIGAQIAMPQFVRRKQRQATAEIHENIASRYRAVARGSEQQPVA